MSFIFENVLFFNIFGIFSGFPGKPGIFQSFPIFWNFYPRPFEKFPFILWMVPLLNRVFSKIPEKVSTLLGIDLSSRLRDILKTAIFEFAAADPAHTVLTLNQSRFKSFP